MGEESCSGAGLKAVRPHGAERPGESLSQTGGTDEKLTLAPLREDEEDSDKEVRNPFQSYGDWEAEEDEDEELPKASHSFDSDCRQEEAPDEAEEVQGEAEVRIGEEPEEFEYWQGITLVCKSRVVKEFLPGGKQSVSGSSTPTFHDFEEKK